MDNSELKYRHWVVTISPACEIDVLPESQKISDALKKLSEAFVFQKEKATSEHYQVCLVSKYRMRHRTLLKGLSEALELPLECITLDRMQGTWDQAVKYVTKEDTRIQGPFFHAKVCDRMNPQISRFSMSAITGIPGRKVFSRRSLILTRAALKLPMIGRLFGLQISKGVLGNLNSLNGLILLILVLSKFHSERQRS